jgi:beta-lactamase class A
VVSTFVLLATVAMMAMSENRQQPASLSAPGAAEREIGRLVAPFDGLIGVAAKDLSTGEEIALNADARFPTASTIKVAVMLEAWHRAAEGGLSLDDAIELRDRHKVGGAGVLSAMHDGLRLTIRDLIHLMIVLSDNTATNLLIERLGTARIDSRLAAYGLRETHLFRPTFRDGRADLLPALEAEYGLGMTTPREMARLLAAIAGGTAAGREASAAMLETLRRQQDRAMIPRLLPQDGVQVANKTGTDAEKRPRPDGVRRHVRADVGIVTGPALRYVIAIYARQIADGRSGVENDGVVTGARISKIVYDYFSRRP